MIWADVQGAEENLIKGGLKTLSHTKYFYTEYEDDELYEGQITLDQIKNLLPNFKAIGYFGNNVLFKNTALQIHLLIMPIKLFGRLGSCFRRKSGCN